jgi:hypothetical protein
MEFQRPTMGLRAKRYGSEVSTDRFAAAGCQVQQQLRVIRRHQRTGDERHRVDGPRLGDLQHR